MLSLWSTPVVAHLGTSRTTSGLRTSGWPPLVYSVFFSIPTGPGVSQYPLPRVFLPNSLGMLKLDPWIPAWHLWVRAEALVRGSKRPGFQEKGLWPTHPAVDELHHLKKGYLRAPLGEHEVLCQQDTFLPWMQHYLKITECSWNGPEK